MKSSIKVVSQEVVVDGIPMTIVVSKGTYSETKKEWTKVHVEVRPFQGQDIGSSSIKVTEA